MGSIFQQKKILKRYNALKHWKLDKFGSAFFSHFLYLGFEPSSGPHKSRKCFALILVLRNRWKYALTYREVISILMQRHVLAYAKVRTDETYPASFINVVSIPKINENFHILYDTKVLFCLPSILDDEAKLCKVSLGQFGGKVTRCHNTYDGRTIRYPDPLVKANDKIKLTLEIREKHKGTLETIHIQEQWAMNLPPVLVMFLPLERAKASSCLSYRRDKARKRHATTGVRGCLSVCPRILVSFAC
ncbi:hypothetical protein K2173_007655 [Erythroxylum novogranatense]|uniref:Small ribosomal subunit protein eS4 central region domain-containing protein n=1 Tax=Erythroxylum novogranatense TaxID=1862640 RepID=A0AAV8TS54_9ROSI|nr:hypothetical protein K2173_007655 [Erythroxylum novogranatense]